jgi:uncharacterized protein YceH (UPF0502 family)
METLPQLDAIEIRVLGVLMEKEKATPEYYPMTINSMMNACNQKSSRNPVVNYSESEIQLGIDGLKKRGLILTVTGGGSRVFKYKHNASIVFDLDEREEAILCLLFLRGPLTPGEINSNSGRLYSFGNLESVQNGLESLRNKEHSMVIQLPKRPGQKEARYMHLLAGPVNEADWEDAGEPVKITSSHLEERMATLEAEMAELKLKLGDLLK